MSRLPGIHVGCGISGRVRRVGLFGPLLKQFERLAIRLDPLPQLRIRRSTRRTSTDRIGSPHASRHGSELFVRSPKKREGILIVGNAESAERRDIERVADVRQPVQTRQPPDGKSRGGDRKADRQDERDPHQLAEPLAQQLKQSSATYHSPPQVRDSRIGSA